MIRCQYMPLLWRTSFHNSPISCWYFFSTSGRLPPAVLPCQRVSMISIVKLAPFNDMTRLTPFLSATSSS